MWELNRFFILWLPLGLGLNCAFELGIDWLIDPSKFSSTHEEAKVALLFWMNPRPLRSRLYSKLSVWRFDCLLLMNKIWFRVWARFGLGLLQFRQLLWPRCSNDTFWISSQAATCLPVYRTRWRLHSLLVFFIRARLVIFYSFIGNVTSDFAVYAKPISKPVSSTCRVCQIQKMPSYVKRFYTRCKTMLDLLQLIVRIKVFARIKAIMSKLISAKFLLFYFVFLIHFCVWFPGQNTRRK